MADNPLKYYPYQKIYSGFYDLSQTVDIPRRVIDYLLDMPDGNYTPPDDNSFPRSRMWKYLYYDGANPLANPLPTPKQKREVLFNPDKAEDPPNKEKGYRLIPQIFEKPAQIDSQTRIFAFVGRTIAESDFTIQMSIVFQIWTHYTQEANTKLDNAYSRTLAIEQCLIEALHGVNMKGVGSFYFDRTQHPDCGDTILNDRDNNVCRQVTFGLTIMSETLNEPNACNIPLNNGSWD